VLQVPWSHRVAGEHPTLHRCTGYTTAPIDRIDANPENGIRTEGQVRVQFVTINYSFFGRYGAFPNELHGFIYFNFNWKY
jgi:hypothetical protein